MYWYVFLRLELWVGPDARGQRGERDFRSTWDVAEGKGTGAHRASNRRRARKTRPRRGTGGEILGLEHHRCRRGCWPRPSVANIASHCSTHLGHDIERPIRTQGLDLRMTLRHTQYAGRLIFARGACYGTMREDALIHGEPRSWRVAESRQTAGGQNEAAKRQTRGTHRGNDRRLGRGGARIVHSATTTRYRWRTRSVHILPRIRL